MGSAEPLLVSTLPGLLDALRLEARTRGLRVAGEARPCWLLAEGKLRDALALRTAETVSRILVAEEVPSVEPRCIRLALRRAVRQLEPGQYSVRAYVYGECFSRGFLELVAARELARVLGREALSRRGCRLRVVLDCSYRLLIAAVQVHGEPLHLRRYYVVKHPSPLNPLIAAAIAVLMGHYGSVYDPFCGSGTIPIEYAVLRGARAVGSDVSPRYASAARLNAAVAGVDIDVFAADAARCPLVSSADLVATDPPRSPGSRAAARFYGYALNIALRLGADLCLVTPYRFAALRVARRAGFHPAAGFSAVQGGQRVYAVLLRRG